MAPTPRAPGVQEAAPPAPGGTAVLPPGTSHSATLPPSSGSPGPSDAAPPRPPSPADRPDDADSNPDCVICYQPLHLRRLCRMVAPCGHVFHATCLTTWASNCPHSETFGCPLCRQLLESPLFQGLHSLVARNQMCWRDVPVIVDPIDDLVGLHDWESDDDLPRGVTSIWSNPLAEVTSMAAPLAPVAPSIAPASASPSGPHGALDLPVPGSPAPSPWLAESMPLAASPPPPAAAAPRAETRGAGAAAGTSAPSPSQPTPAPVPWRRSTRQNLGMAATEWWRVEGTPRATLARSSSRRRHRHSSESGSDSGTPTAQIARHRSRSTSPHARGAFAALPPGLPTPGSHLPAGPRRGTQGYAWGSGIPAPRHQFNWGSAIAGPSSQPPPPPAPTRGGWERW